MSAQVKGVIAMSAACAIWGLSALYYKAIAMVPPLEVLSHRTIWSVVLIGVILMIRGRMCLLPQKAIIPIGLAALMVSVNWFFFIYAVQVGELSQSSLGYYIFPLVAVLLGAVFLGERLTKAQWFAVAMACIAVLILSFGVGSFPVISLILAITLGLYGFFKRPVTIGPMRTVFWEVMMILPCAIVWLIGIELFDWAGLTGRSGGYFGQDLKISGLLMFSGVMTAAPLILMSYAIERLRFATVGLVQYLNPTLQFLVATMVFMEPFGTVNLIAFGFIWVGLAIYSWAAMKVQPITN